MCNINLCNSDINNLIRKFFESKNSYWVTEMEYSLDDTIKNLSEGKSVYLKHLVGNVYLTQEKLQTGINKVLKEYEHKDSIVINNRLNVENLTEDLIDSIIQLGLLGTLIYG